MKFRRLRKSIVSLSIVSMTIIVTGKLLTGCTYFIKKEKPNLIFVFSDQQSYDMLGCYGNSQIITPNLDKLAREGLLFSNCFSNCPICSPYRSMLMSGRHPLNNGCYTNDVALVPGHGKKLAEVLRDEGYATAYIGKWHLLGGNRRRPVPEGEMRYGFDEIFLTNNCHVDFRPGHCFYWNKKGERIYFDTWEVYGQTNQALDFLDQRPEDKRPFALFVSWHPPHDWGKFVGIDGEKHYRYDTMDEFMEMYDRDSIKMRPGMQDNPDLRHMYHGYMAQVSGVDKAFGMLMEKLDEIGESENTLVIFTSDHGDMLEFEGADTPKQYPHDYSLHVPFIASFPGKIEPGNKTELLFSALDIMPTLLGLMGLPVPPEVHGKDLSSAVIGRDEDAVDYIPVWMYTPKNWRGVITKDYTFARAKDPDKTEELSVLFNRKKDPFQLENLFGEKDYQKVQAELWEITRKWMEHYGDNFWELDDFKAAANKGKYIAPPYEQPIDLLKRLPNE